MLKKGRQCDKDVQSCNNLGGKEGIWERSSDGHDEREETKVEDNMERK